MKYAIITSTGFQMNGSEAATYDTMKEAMDVAAPGDSIIPIYDTVHNVNRTILPEVLGLRKKADHSSAG